MSEDERIVWRLQNHQSEGATIFSYYFPETIDIFILYIKNDIKKEFQDNQKLWLKILEIIDNRYYSNKYK